MYHGEVNVAQEELNSFLAVAEELRVKGLTQNNQGGSGSSSSKKDSFSTAPRPQAAAPRLPDPVPPPKKPRPTAAAAPSYSGHDDDDIQEVIPTVKTEPLQAAAVAPEPYQQQEQGGQLQQVDDGMGYDEEGYEDYGAYGADGGYEGTLVDADGNKGKSFLSIQQLEETSVNLSIWEGVKRKHVFWDFVRTSEVWVGGGPQLFSRKYIKLSKTSN